LAIIWQFWRFLPFGCDCCRKFVRSVNDKIHNHFFLNTSIDDQEGNLKIQYEIPIKIEPNKRWQIERTVKILEKVRGYRISVEFEEDKIVLMIE